MILRRYWKTDGARRIFSVNGILFIYVYSSRLYISKKNITFLTFHS